MGPEPKELNAEGVPGPSGKDWKDTTIRGQRDRGELLSNLVFDVSRSCGDLACVGGFNSVFELDAGDDFGEVIKAA